MFFNQFQKFTYKDEFYCIKDFLSTIDRRGFYLIVDILRKYLRFFKNLYFNRAYIILFFVKPLLKS